jgi:hypothetical protein
MRLVAERNAPALTGVLAQADHDHREHVLASAGPW